MKKLFTPLLIALTLVIFGTVTNAKAENYGVYVTPKFLTNIQHAKFDVSSHSVEDGTESGHASDTATRAGGGLALGYDFNYRFQVPVRAELEFMKSAGFSMFKDIVSTDKDAAIVDGFAEASIETSTLLVNIYYDFKNSTKFTPYVGAGIGIAFVKTAFGVEDHADGYNNYFSNTKTTFAGQVGLGCSYAVSDNISLDLGYRFLMVGNGYLSADFGYGEQVEIKSKDLYSHQITLGIRLTF